MPNSHDILFCTNDAVALDGLTRFIAAALREGNPAIVWATELHRCALIQRLRADGVDVDGAIERGTYIASDVAEVAEPGHVLMTLKGLSEAASKVGKKHPRVAACGERAGRLWADGKTDAAIRLEQLFNELAKIHDMNILCVYPLPDAEEYKPALNRLCAEHTTMSFRWSEFADGG